MNQNPIPNTVWERQLEWFNDSSQYRTLDTIDGEPMEFEWNIFPGFTTLQLCNKVQEFINKMGDPSQFKGRIIFMSMFNDILWGSEDNERECNAKATLVSLFAKRFPAGRWSFLGPGSETKWYSTYNERPQGKWDRVPEFDDDEIRRKRTPSFPCHESTVSRSAQKAKEVENFLYTSVPMGILLKLFFAQLFLLISSVSTEQSQICVMNTVSAKLAQGDLLWQSNPTHLSRQQTC